LPAHDFVAAVQVNRHVKADAADVIVKGGLFDLPIELR
jgi:hypothetical protein